MSNSITSSFVDSFKSKIEILGINPYVLLPKSILNSLFQQAGKEKGPIPVRGTIDDYAFIQTLVKYQGQWRLYINGPMLKSADKRVGDSALFYLEFDPEERVIPMHPKLATALKNNPKADEVFHQMPLSRQKEVKRYIANLKTEEVVTKNIALAIQFLIGKGRFAGRDKPL